MANPNRQAITAIGAATPIGLDYWQSPFNVSIEVDVSQAVGAVYSVQYTMDDIFGYNSQTPGVSVANPLWTTDVNLPIGTAVSGHSNYLFPIMAVRIVPTVLTSGTIYFKVLQGMGVQ
jgi:hypothetical protein